MLYLIKNQYYGIIYKMLFKIILILLYTLCYLNKSQQYYIIIYFYLNVYKCYVIIYSFIARNISIILKYIIMCSFILMNINIILLYILLSQRILICACAHCSTPRPSACLWLHGRIKSSHANECARRNSFLPSLPSPVLLYTTAC